MKTKELIKKLDEVTDIFASFLVGRKAISVIYDSDSSGNMFLVIPLGAKTWMDLEFDSELAPTDKSIRQQVASRVNKYLRTPRAQRQEEKQYRVRFLDDGDGSKNYLGIDSDGSWILCALWSHADDDECTFTKSRIKKLGLTGKCWTLEEVIDDE